ncbi:MAG: FliM/FliN family flagellar motor switch protein, partial [Planctomycetota bacterium]
MSEAEEETQPDATESAETATAVETETAEEAPAADQSDTKATDASAESQPEFQPLRPAGRSAEGNFELNRFGGVQVVLTAELGRTQLTLQELMSLSEGAVLE